MTKSLAFMLVAITLYCTSFAQKTETTLSGFAKDNNGKPLIAATILLQKTKDSSIVKTDITDANGKFEMLHLAPGNYFITATAVGFAPTISNTLHVEENTSLQAGTLMLQPIAKNLSGVTVTAKKPLVEVRADKLVLNVENSINATGSNALELLQKSPGVVVDKDDNISLKGKSGVRIYIDGRPSQMDTKDLAALLRSMNSADIEAIEFITNPSAKYDASGNAGIINIKLKKDKRFGLNGSFTTGIRFGITPKNSNSFSINYRYKKLNFFGNFSDGFGKNENKFNLYRKQADSLFDQKSIQINNNQPNNFKAGADYFIDKKSTLGFIVTANLSANNNNSQSTTPITSLLTGILGRTLQAQNLVLANRNNLNYNTNYKWEDTSGHQLNIDADYGTFKLTSTSYQPNMYVYPNGSIMQIINKNSTPIHIEIATAKVDYEQKFAKGKLGFGAKYSSVKTKNTFDFWDVINNKDQYNKDRSNKFTYKEKVAALYLNYNRAFTKKWTLQAGIRMENTSSEGNLTSYQPPKPTDNVQRKYTNFFPSTSISYTANEKNQLSATYSRRINRPSYQDLNPFENKIDELTFQKGNAFLRPEYANSIEISHIYKFKLITTLGYTHIKDLKANITDTADKTKAYITNKNLASQNIVSLNIGSPITFTKWWSGYFNGNLNYSKYKAQFDDGKVVNLGAANYSLFGQNSFTIGKGLTAELSGFYNGPGIWGATFKSKPLGGIDLGLQKTILNNKGTIKLSITDIAHTQSFRGISNYGGTYLDVNGNWESRQLRLNFSYRFGKTTVKAARNRNTSSDEESKRLNGGSSGPGGN